MTEYLQRITFVSNFVDIGKMINPNYYSFHCVMLILALTASAALATTENAIFLTDENQLPR